MMILLIDERRRRRRRRTGSIVHAGHPGSQSAEPSGRVCVAAASSSWGYPARAEARPITGFRGDDGPERVASAIREKRMRGNGKNEDRIFISQEW